MPKAAPLLCFVHRGNARCLDVAVAQARACGCLVVVIGDDGTRLDTAVTFLPIGDFATRSDLFAQRYRHLSVNDKDYELFCFQRWFVMWEFLRRYRMRVWCADHDVLVFPRFLLADAQLSAMAGRCRYMNSSWLCPLDFRYASELVGFYEKLYTRGRLDEMGERHRVGSALHVSDMTAMIEFCRPRSEVFDAVYRGSEVGFDRNIRLSEGFETCNGHKRFTWSAGRPFAHRTDREALEFSSLHLQGPSKLLIGLLHTIPPGRSPPGPNGPPQAPAGQWDEDSASVAREYDRLRAVVGASTGAPRLGGGGVGCG